MLQIEYTKKPSGPTLRAAIRKADLDPDALPGYNAAAWCLDQPDAAAELAELEAMRDELDKLVAARERRLATLDYPEHELAAIRSALAATRCAA